MSARAEPEDLRRYQDWIVEAEQGAFVEESRLIGAGEVFVTRIRDNPPGDYPDPPLQEIMLTICRQGPASFSGRYGERRIDTVVPTGGFVIAPAGVGVEAEVAHTFGIDSLAARPATLERLLERVPELAPLSEAFFQDPLVSQLAEALAAVGERKAAAFVDHALAALFLRLEQLARSGPRRADAARALAPDVLKRVIDLMQARLEENLSLADLARAAGLPPTRFARGFKAATGRPPYAFLREIRTERARELVVRSRLPLADIAYQCGFSSQAHMTSAFTKTFGVSPGRLRRDAQRSGPSPRSG